ncbi:UNVERIFIED_CONTAM: hypothetical protein Sradi_0703500 [Sesamum radiatum]|uniref:Uncharacterized protein n=1 Tax=Sesamum radiatum TaxID=300843 RepID=A0AAW2VPS4_SESRA
MGKLGRIDSLLKAVKGVRCSSRRDDHEDEETFKKLLQSKEKVAKLHSTSKTRWADETPPFGRWRAPRSLQLQPPRSARSESWMI